MLKDKNKIAIIVLLFLLILLSFRFFPQNQGTSPEKVANRDYFIFKPDSLLKEQLDEIDGEFLNNKVTVEIAAVGDIMFHSPQIKSGYNPLDKTYDFYPVFNKIEKYIKNADLALGNYETVSVGEEYGFSGYPRFNAPKEALKALGEVGFDVLSTANNHSIDRGKAGIINTIDYIKKYNMENIGTSSTPRNELMVREINGINIGLLSYTYGCNGLEVLLSEEELSYMVNIIDEYKIKNDIIRAEKLGADIITIFIHWGNEYQLSPSKEQQDLAKKLINWGADIILGSHPHVIQRSEIIKHEGKDKFIIYSMGNFVSNQRRETISNRNRNYTEDGVIVKLKLEKDIIAGETILKEVKYVPTWVNRYRENGKLKYEILPTNEYLEKENSQIKGEKLIRIRESYNQTITRMAF